MNIQTKIFTQQCVKPTMLERKHMAKSINELGQRFVFGHITHTGLA
jgi:hypothetical protein